MPDHILFAHSLNGPVPGAALTGPEIGRVLAAEELAWVHLRADDPGAPDWIETHLPYLPAAVRNALTARETRPRVFFHGDGAMLFLRGVNTNPGAEPEDMVSLRLWIDPARIVSLSLRPLASVRELREEIAAGQGPRAVGPFLTALIERLNRRIAARVDTLDTDGEEIEDTVLRAHADASDLRPRITEMRQELVDLRRYLRPQQHAVAQLAMGPVLVEDRESRLRFAEAAEALQRNLDELEGLSERMVVARDEIASAHSDRLNRNLYMLSVISVIFLPLGFLTGLMGINLAGMPGAEWRPAFWVFTGGLGVVFILQLVLLRRLRFV